MSTLDELRAANAKLEGEIERMHAHSKHSTAKLVAVCSLVAALAASPGFWSMFKAAPIPEPPVTKIEFNAVSNTIDQIATDVAALKTAAEVDRAKTDTRLSHLEKFADNLTPKHHARIPR